MKNCELWAADVSMFEIHYQENVDIVHNDSTFPSHQATIPHKLARGRLKVMNYICVGFIYLFSITAPRFYPPLKA